ncbi:ABC transporter permease [Devosia sp. Root105]|uniref:ABC transporter permease n=1 Tax=Devosia sp. Root105 TaxID=1736423 RepID=UPI0006FCD7C7|nr:ABC transporter permease [Devosia sp. Root105]KQU97547.1 sugar ABC transporter permease [Devosia sp. Root105]
MRIKLEKRQEPSKLMQVVTPIASVLLTMLVGVVVFDLLGIDGQRAVIDIFLTPLLASYKWQDVAVKAAPLIIIALGLSIGNRANVWNIGAEGQYIIGALCAAGVGIAAGTAGGPIIIVTMILAGMVGGSAWAAVPAALRTRFGVNEILSSLMLTYVALQVLSYLVGGPWKDPNGRNFPATAPLQPDQTLPILFSGTTVHLGVAIAVVLPFVFWLLMSRSVFGYQIRVVGSAPNAARHGGFDGNQTVWLAMLIGGGMAGLAGALEFAGSLKAINLGFPSGYGFTAIIVSFLGRLHPIGCLIAGIVLAVTYVGGQVAQTTVHIPNATAGIFQAMMLFFILASDIFVRYRVRFIRSAKAVVQPAPGE